MEEGKSEGHLGTAPSPEQLSISQSSGSSASLGQALSVSIYTSKRLLSFIFVTHSVAFLIVCLLSWPWWISVLFAGLVLLSGWQQLRSHYFKNGMELAYSDQHWYAITNGVKSELYLFGEYYVSSWMIVLRFRTDGTAKKRVLVLLSDSADPQELRRLRVLLRLGNL